MSSNSTSRNEQPHAKQAGKQAGKQAKSEVADDEIGAPRKMAEELRVMEGMTKQLLDTIKGSTNTYGRRHGTGAQIRSLVRGILEQNQSAQASRVKVEQHQARQEVVEAKIQEVQDAEVAIDGLIHNLQYVEGELSYLLHRAKASREKDGRRGQLVEAEDVVAYASHCSFSTSCGVRWFTAENKPLHPPHVRDERFMLPFPPDHAMRLQGGMFSFASARRPQPPSDETEASTGEQSEDGKGGLIVKVEKKNQEGEAGAHEGESNGGGRKRRREEEEEDDEQWEEEGGGEEQKRARVGVEGEPVEKGEEEREEGWDAANEDSNNGIKFEDSRSSGSESGSEEEEMDMDLNPVVPEGGGDGGEVGGGEVGAGEGGERGADGGEGRGGGEGEEGGEGGEEKGEGGEAAGKAGEGDEDEDSSGSDDELDEHWDMDLGAAAK